jgi:hypothetical protein
MPENFRGIPQILQEYVWFGYDHIFKSVTIYDSYIIFSFYSGDSKFYDKILERRPVILSIYKIIASVYSKVQNSWHVTFICLPLIVYL